MKKRGQITLFMIVGIVLVLISGITWYGVSTLSDPDKPPGTDMERVNSFLEFCVEEIIEEAAFLAGFKGGYTTIPTSVASKDGFYTDVVYWYSLHTPTSVNKFTVENQIEDYLDRYLNTCVSDFEVFDLDISAGLLRSEVYMQKDGFSVALHYPIVIRKPGQTESKEGFLFSYDHSFPLLFKEVNSFIASFAVDPSVINENELLGSKYYTTVTDFDNGEYLISFIDFNNTFRTYPYRFQIALRVPRGEVNYAPVWNESYYLEVGQSFIPKLSDPNGDRMTVKMFPDVGTYDSNFNRITFFEKFEQQIIIFEISDGIETITESAEVTVR